jgi:hypothetical protein
MSRLSFELGEEPQYARHTGGPLSFATALRQAMGEQAWSALDPHIGARFSPTTGPKHRLRFVGDMNWVYCSPLGSLLARLLRRAALLPERCARKTPFEFRIGERQGEFIKERDYHLSPHRVFRFRSVFRAAPRLHEEFRGGLGMYLQLREKRGALLFRDRGYFLRVGSWRIPLPRWLTMGRFELLHRSLDAERFQVLLRVAHPLFGTLFYQRGEFRRAAPGRARLYAEEEEARWPSGAGGIYSIE